ncbi:hypothetical protein [Plantactinospora endophytica]|uniref:Mce-associated membrane protein n=1 Tax=Plantactinospora endophytica TaxID=673535 RepID=A0ABQ4DXA3_9ACTN|nr:hypothetical protein [Plantactinospora endophytica]GIG87090.1 hypothetical protein Pen02_20260 [Plantactinospora endophytica]
MRGVRLRSSIATLVRRLRPARRTAEAPTAEAPTTEASTADGTERASDGEAARRRRHAGSRLHLVLVLATVLAAAAAGTAWYAQHRADQRDTAVRQALATAAPAAKAIFSYDYRSFDASVANGRSFVTGAFADDYAETTSALKSTAVAEQAVVLAEVSASGVVRAGTAEVELLVYLNQYRRNANTDGEKVDQNRVILELRRVGGDWKVARATAI